MTQTCVAIVVVFLVCQLPIWAIGCVDLIQEFSDTKFIPLVGKRYIMIKTWLRACVPACVGIKTSNIVTGDSFIHLFISEFIPEFIF